MLTTQPAELDGVEIPVFQPEETVEPPPASVAAPAAPAPHVSGSVPPWLVDAGQAATGPADTAPGPEPAAQPAGTTGETGADDQGFTPCVVDICVCGWLCACN